ncbi:hypothetical protein AWN88_11275 [Agrobacterium tumefaciens]|nr:hypothetical protein AWN88_11275 [Agrobacterium tumefaciens]KAJ36256.1 hypothetical protein BW45_23075 [Agrobacterium tumefaciens]
MTIHAKFWKERYQPGIVSLGSMLRSVRDSNRQRCYKWEWKDLRPIQKKLGYDEARGYARLCAKIAIRRMRETGLMKSDEVADEVRASFKAAFTKERLKRCDGSAHGVYFAEWGWTDVIIAHEVAHWADQWAHRLSGNLAFGRVDYEAHGPLWRGWFVHILAHAGLRSMVGLLDPINATRRMMTESLDGARMSYVLP